MYTKVIKARFQKVDLGFNFVEYKKQLKPRNNKNRGGTNERLFSRRKTTANEHGYKYPNDSLGIFQSDADESKNEDSKNGDETHEPNQF